MYNYGTTLAGEWLSELKSMSLTLAAGGCPRCLQALAQFAFNSTNCRLSWGRRNLLWDDTQRIWSRSTLDSSSTCQQQPKYYYTYYYYNSNNYTVFQKVVHQAYINNLVNSQRIFKIPYWHTLWKICDKTIIKDFTTPKTCLGKCNLSKIARTEALQPKTEGAWTKENVIMVDEMVLRK